MVDRIKISHSVEVKPSVNLDAKLRRDSERRRRSFEFTSQGGAPPGSDICEREAVRLCEACVVILSLPFGFISALSELLSV